MKKNFKKSNPQKSSFKLLLLLGSIFSYIGISLLNQDSKAYARIINKQSSCMSLISSNFRLTEDIENLQIRRIPRIEYGNRQSSQSSSSIDKNKESQNSESNSSYSNKTQPTREIGSSSNQYNFPIDQGGDGNRPPNKKSSFQRSHEIDFVEQNNQKSFKKDQESQTSFQLSMDNENYHINENNHIRDLQNQIENLKNELNRVNIELNRANTELNRTNREHNVQIERLIQAHNNNIQQIHDRLVTENNNQSIHLMTQIENLNNQIQNLIETNTQRFEKINQDHRTSVVEIVQREEIYNQRVERFQQTYREELRELIQREREILSVNREPTVIINTIGAPPINQSNLPAQTQNLTIHGPNVTTNTDTNTNTNTDTNPVIANSNETSNEVQTETETQTEIEIEQEQRSNSENRDGFWNQFRAFLLGMATATAGLTLRDYFRLRRRSKTGFRVPKPRIQFD